MGTFNFRYTPNFKKVIALQICEQSQLHNSREDDSRFNQVTEHISDLLGWCGSFEEIGAHKPLNKYFMHVNNFIIGF
jgi:hypothetical protein